MKLKSENFAGIMRIVRSHLNLSANFSNNPRNFQIWMITYVFEHISSP